MPLYVCNDPYGFGSAVEMDLFQLVEQDSRFGDTGAATGGDCASAIGQILYPPSIDRAGRKLISDLANNTPATSIIIYGVNATWPLDGGGYVYQRAGQTIPPTTPGGPIKIIYDVTNAFGAGYFVYDSAGNYVAFPTFLILAHELFHALHIAFRTQGSDPEAQAIADENTVRQQFGCVARDPRNHNGCTTGGLTDPSTGQFIPFQPSCQPPASVAPCPGAGSGPGQKHCIVVTAAYGSPLAPQVQWFQYIRDRYLRRTIIGGFFFDQLASEYYRFSPSISEDILVDLQLRTNLNRLLIVPLLNFLVLLVAYIERTGTFQAAATQLYKRVSP